MLWAALTDTFLGATAIPGATTLLVATVAAGCVMLIATRRFAELALVAVPSAALVMASTLRLYPIAGRLVLFAAPMSALLLASSLLVLVHRDGSARSVWLTAVPTAVVAIVAARGVVAQLNSTEGREESRALVRAAMRQHTLGKPVWVSGGAEAAWRFYSGQIVTTQRATETGPLSAAGRSIAPGILVGAWYNRAPERILPTPGETAADATPSAWSESEALRVRAIARPCVLLFLSQTQAGEGASLLNSLTRLGGGVAQSWRAPGAALHDVCFATPAAARSQ
jgi:hypothetical protein